jgi:hypothetical protein
MRRGIKAMADGDIGTRAEHLAWAKQRALAYLERGDIQNAFASIASDLGKHSETRGHAALELGMMLLVSGVDLRTPAEMRKFIEGIN